MEVYISVEGQTEETFVKDILAPFFSKSEIWLIPVILKTSHLVDGRGGMVSLEKAKREIKKLLKRKDVYVTTMYDFYGLPNTFTKDIPPIKQAFSSIDKVLRIEQHIDTIIDSPRFKAYLQIHEFEALLFCNKSHWFSHFGISNEEQINAIDKIIQAFPNPEEINDNPKTAPSKRIEAIFPTFDKIWDGVFIADNTGIQVMREKCPHFKSWTDWLLNLKR